MRIGERGPYEQSAVRRASATAIAKTWPAATFDEIFERLSEIDRDASMLELTAGVDSRLVLAMLLRVGVTPRRAFTIGMDGSDDVRVAKELSRVTGIEHLTIAASVDNVTAQDAAEFVGHTGWRVNTCSYAWLPSVFRELEPLRNAQITGAGGELAGGFYYSPLDRFIRSLPISRWRRYRLEKPGNQARQLIRAPLLRAALHEADCHLSELLGCRREPIHSALDRLYFEERMRNWALPVLDASRQWYHVIAPFFSQAYMDWSTCLVPAQSPLRSGQIELIRQFAPQLLDIPFGSLDASRRPSPSSKLARKITRRIMGRRGSGDLLAAQTAELLCRAPEMVDRLSQLAVELKDAMRQDVMEQMMRDPANYPHELGALMTAANAAYAGDSLGPRTSTGHASA